MHDYQTKGCSRFGAAMGRASTLDRLNCVNPVTLRAVPLDQGGYDPGGAYWGTPSDLYLATDAEGHTFYFRQTDFDGARAAIKRVIPDAVIVEPSEVTDEDIADMFEGYATCALWSSTDDEDQPLDDRFNSSDLSEETAAEMRKDCANFARANASALLACIGKGQCDWSRAGHDLWLNRNGHGAGFWDGDWPKPHSVTLDKAARDFGSAWLYVGDDEKIHGG